MSLKASQPNVSQSHTLQPRHTSRFLPTNPLPHVSLDVAGLVALADLSTIAQRTALTGTSTLLDALVICPGIHRQQYASELNGGELPATAALTSGYVFRVENQGTVAYLQKMGVAGHLVTLGVESVKPQMRLWSFLPLQGSSMASSLFYVTAVILAVTSLDIMVLLQDWWGLAMLLVLVLARCINIVIIRRRRSLGWKGASEPGKYGDLLILLSQDRWIRLQGLVDDLKKVTAGQWLRDMSFVESSFQALATLLVYLDAVLASNMTQMGKIVLLALLLLSAGSLGISNELEKTLHMHGCIIKLKERPIAYKRRIDLAEQLVKETGRDDWAVRLGMINRESSLESTASQQEDKVIL